MATSRTGTSQWKKARSQAINRALRLEQHTCPFCNTELNYQQGRQPNSPEVDHIVPHSKGGTNDPSNLRIICRRCNQSRGNRTAPKTKARPSPTPLRVSRKW
ncbi:MAG: HNH endonuclease [Arthrobacter sp.]|jgi:5-methylcytosine-specific restriction endonuclease McrA|nr:HNH endonuclease [Arthrobacter sp.]